MKSLSFGLGVALLLSTRALPAAEPASPQPSLINAIRQADAAKVSSSLDQPGALTARDAVGNTALHWAALANNSKWVERLVAAGADIHAVNQAGATPIHYATGNEDIVQLLLRAGADANAKTLLGTTPLQTAAARPNGYGSVKRLLDAGAAVDAPRLVFPTADASQGEMSRITPLALAIYYGDPRSARLLLERGAAPGGAIGFTPVASAAFSGHSDWVETLVKRGGEVNFDEGFLGHALNNLLYADQRSAATFLIEHGSDLHRMTSFGERTPPMVWSAYSETGDVAVASALVAKGVDINEATGAGHTALDWAVKRGDTPLVAYLRAHGGKTSAAPSREKTPPSNSIPAEPAERATMIRQSVQRAMEILQHSSDGFLGNGFVKKSGCVSCHQQSLPAVAYARARERGLTVDEASLALQLNVQRGALTKTFKAVYEMMEPTPDSPTSLGYGLWAMNSVGYAPDDVTEAMVWYVAHSQLQDGSFPGFDRRPPMEEGRMIGTAFAVNALRQFPQPLHSFNLDKTFERARAWLMTYEPKDPNERIHRYLGLGWAGAKRSVLHKITREILAAQQADGGWAGLPTLASDAWATGLTLFALHEIGNVPVTDEHYRRGVDFLLRTQYADGSWLVPTRTWPLQPHFDSGFPHGRDQWISAAGTAWAAIALLNELPVAAPRLQFPAAQVLMAKHPLPVANPIKSTPEPSLAKDVSPAQSDPIFTRDILPIFEKSCLGCHKGDKPKGDFSLESVAGLLKGGQSGEAAIQPGKPNASPLLRFVQDEVEDLEMPPLSKRAKYPPLSKEDIEKLDHWISLVANGAP